MLQAEVKAAPGKSENQPTNSDRDSRAKLVSVAIFTADFNCDFLLKEDLWFPYEFGDCCDGEKHI